MNRIILIGNGFDRAHGLETAYEHFIDDFWRRKGEKIKKVSHEKFFEDEDVFMETKINNLSYFFEGWHSFENYSDFSKAIDDFEKSLYSSDVTFTIKNKFLRYISEVVVSQNWVDIEEAYHMFLNSILEINSSINTGAKLNFTKSVFLHAGYQYRSVEDLHQDFENIRIALEEYLTRITKGEVQIIDDVKDVINSELRLKDFTSKGQTTIVKEQYHKVANDFLIGESYKAARIYDSSFSHLGEKEMLDSIKGDLDEGDGSLKEYDLSPNELLFLNFNYTNLEKLYAKEDDQVIHIHGELNNPNNPIIFGYGDELCDEYKELEKLNNNEYLENIKSIKYLETRNYKDLLSFIDSEEYQIFVFGHSCGNSDRTLLNTLFEHQNCVSIKVFYHGTKEKNNYSDVVRNISRNFGDKKALREKVVNKEFSEALPQVTLQ